MRLTLCQPMTTRRCGYTEEGGLPILRGVPGRTIGCRRMTRCQKRAWAVQSAPPRTFGFAMSRRLTKTASATVSMRPNTFIQLFVPGDGSYECTYECLTDNSRMHTTHHGLHRYPPARLDMRRNSVEIPRPAQSPQWGAYHLSGCGVRPAHAPALSPPEGGSTTQGSRAYCRRDYVR
jgi:hypothetical protein